METKSIVRALAAIAHESRLEAYRYLVQAGPAGLPAGQLSELVGIAPSSLSFHLKELVNAGLLSSRQEGRFVFRSEEHTSELQSLMRNSYDVSCLQKTKKLTMITINT